MLPMQGDSGSITGQGTRSCVPQLRPGAVKLKKKKKKKWYLIVNWGEKNEAAIRIQRREEGPELCRWL